MFELKEKKGAGGKTLVGLWATRAEKAEVQRLAKIAGCGNVADYFRVLIKNDIESRRNDPLPPRTFEVNVRSRSGPFIPQLIAAPSLTDALVIAASIPVEAWVEEETGS